MISRNLQQLFKGATLTKLSKKVVTVFPRIVFRGNYSFLNLTLCTVTFAHSTYRCGNYSREETIQGRKLYEEIRYMFCDQKSTARSAQINMVEWMGRNFDVFPGFQKIPCYA